MRGRASAAALRSGPASEESGTDWEQKEEDWNPLPLAATGCPSSVSQCAPICVFICISSMCARVESIYSPLSFCPFGLWCRQSRLTVPVADTDTDDCSCPISVKKSDTAGGRGEHSICLHEWRSRKRELESVMCDVHLQFGHDSLSISAHSDSLPFLPSGQLL